jgi:hypothetical protein
MYLHDWQGKVDPQEAPIGQHNSREGFVPILTVGFENQFRYAGPTRYVYAYSPSGMRILKSRGDLTLNKLHVGRIFGSGGEFLITSMLGEVAISEMVQVWVLTDSDAKLVLDIPAGLESVRKLPKAPGLSLAALARSDRHDQDTWKVQFCAWNERDKNCSCKKYQRGHAGRVIPLVSNE